MPMMAAPVPPGPPALTPARRPLAPPAAGAGDALRPPRRPYGPGAGGLPAGDAAAVEQDVAPNLGGESQMQDA